MNIIEQIKAKDQTILLLTVCAFLGLLVMNISTGLEAYAGLVITILSAGGAAIYHKTKNKKMKSEISQSDIKPVKIS